jgi:hypothetical protein
MEGNFIMTPHVLEQKNIRCGVYRDLAKADDAVNRLLAAGFRRDQIDVVCSDVGKERHFSEVQHQLPSGRKTPQAAAVGGIAGLSVGGLIALGLTTAAGMPLLAMGPLLVGGAVAGGLIGAMETRGEEGAAADFYDQSLSRGDLLVAVKIDEAEVGTAERQRLITLADDTLRQAGAVPIPLAAE